MKTEGFYDNRPGAINNVVLDGEVLRITQPKQTTALQWAVRFSLTLIGLFAIVVMIALIQGPEPSRNQQIAEAACGQFYGPMPSSLAKVTGQSHVDGYNECVRSQTKRLNNQ